MFRGKFISGLKRAFGEGQTLSARRTAITGGQESLSFLFADPSSTPMGCLCQATVWWTEPCTELPGTLHASCCHIQPQTGCAFRWQGYVPLERLCTWKPAETDDALGRGVPAPLFIARTLPRDLFAFASSGLWQIGAVLHYCRFAKPWSGPISNESRLLRQPRLQNNPHGYVPTAAVQWSSSRGSRSADNLGILNEDKCCRYFLISKTSPAFLRFQWCRQYQCVGSLITHLL